MRYTASILALLIAAEGFTPASLSSRSKAFGLSSILRAETENGGEVIDSSNSETSAPDVVIVAEEKVPELEVEFSAVETEPILEPEPEPLSVPEEVNSMPETFHVELQPEVESEPEPEPMPVFQVLSPPLEEVDDEGGYSIEEKRQIIENVFECHGFFPDLRSDSQLPESVRKMREQPKSSKELASIKEKYAAMSEADAAFSMLLDIGLMEDYDKLGEYTDDFADDAM